jgi:hypothetical protein
MGINFTLLTAFLPKEACRVISIDQHTCVWSKKSLIFSLFKDDIFFVAILKALQLQLGVLLLSLATTNFRIQ